MSATPELIAAYEEALYVVFGTPELVIRIGEPNPDLDELLEAEGAATAAYITAANPRGEAAGAWRNEVANAALVESLAKAGHRCFEGEGRDPQGRWTPERSALVIGIARADAEAVGRAFGQNAIVFIERGRAPELILLGEIPRRSAPRDDREETEIPVAPLPGMTGRSDGMRFGRNDSMRLVLDTNVWLDWLVFDDPAVAPIKAAVAANRAEVYIDTACAAELERALGYDLGRKFTLHSTAQAACLAECRRVARQIESVPSEAERAKLPRCRDRDDQKFLEAALAARAHFLVTKDRALLDLARRALRFSIVPPGGLAAGL